MISLQQHKIDLREEDPEQSAKRMFTFLRVLKYKPKTDSGSLWVDYTVNYVNVECVFFFSSYTRYFEGWKLASW